GSATYPIPSLKMRQGDFSETLGALQCANAANAVGACGGAFTNAYFVTDTTGNRAQARAGMIFDPATIDASGRRRAFAGNIIPAARINTVGARLLGYYRSRPVAGWSTNTLRKRAAAPAPMSIQSGSTIASATTTAPSCVIRATSATPYWRTSSTTRLRRGMGRTARTITAARLMTRWCAGVGSSTSTTATPTTRTRAATKTKSST